VHAVAQPAAHAHVHLQRLALQRRVRRDGALAGVHHGGAQGAGQQVGAGPEHRDRVPAELDDVAAVPLHLGEEQAEEVVQLRRQLLRAVVLLGELLRQRGEAGDVFQGSDARAVVKPGRGGGGRVSVGGQCGGPRRSPVTSGGLCDCCHVTCEQHGPPEFRGLGLHPTAFHRDQHVEHCVRHEAAEGMGVQTRVRVELRRRLAPLALLQVARYHILQPCESLRRRGVDGFDLRAQRLRFRAGRALGSDRCCGLRCGHRHAPAAAAAPAPRLPNFARHPVVRRQWVLAHGQGADSAPAGSHRHRIPHPHWVFAYGHVAFYTDAPLRHQ
jgi:hypothetical protein